jgi:hypothetical protein
MWEIHDEFGQEHSGEEAIKIEEDKFFKGTGEDTRTHMEDWVHLARLFPHIVTEKDSILLESPAQRRNYGKF